MNIQERILELYEQCTGESKKINELPLTLVSKYQLFEPCIYLSEDENWVNVVILSVENQESSQAMSILKKELTAFGIFNKHESNIEIPQVGSEAEDLYQ